MPIRRPPKDSLFGYIARIPQSGDLDVYPFMYNPETIRRSVAAEWGEVAGPGSIIADATFSKMGQDKYDMKLMLHCIGHYDPAKKGVTAELQKLERFCVSPNFYWDVDDEYFEGLPPPKLWLWAGYPPDPICVVCDGFNVEIALQNRVLDPILAYVDLVFRRVALDTKVDAEYQKQVVNWADKRWL